MDQSAVLKYECFYCYFTGDRCQVTAEAKHVSTMGVTPSLERQRGPILLVSVLCFTSRGLLRLSLIVSSTIKKAADGCRIADNLLGTFVIFIFSLGSFGSYFLFCRVMPCLKNSERAGGPCIRKFPLKSLLHTLLELVLCSDRNISY